MCSEVQEAVAKWAMQSENDQEFLHPMVRAFLQTKASIKHKTGLGCCAITVCFRDFTSDMNKLLSSTKYSLNMCAASQSGS